MVAINWTDQAIYNLTNIAEFIRKDSEKYVILTIKKNIRTRAGQLKQFPSSEKIVSEIDKVEIRERQIIITPDCTL